MKKITVLFALLLSTAGLFAQNQGEFLVELDLVTGDMTKIGPPTPGVNWVFFNERAYDEVNGRFIYRGGPTSATELNTVDVSDGSLIANPTPIDGIMAPEWDNSTQTLYCIKIENSSSYYLQTIDPITGIYTPVATTPTPITGLNGFNQTMNTCDENNQQYIFCYTYYVTYECTLYSVDLQTGVSVSTTLLPPQTDDRMLQICYNNANDTLYGLMYEGSSQLHFLVWIDIQTGTITKIGSGTTLAAPDAGATLDLANRRFIYSYSVYNNGQYEYYLNAMNLDDGSIIYSNEIMLDNLDNVHAVKYDNVRQRLFAIHWDNFISGPLKIDLLSFDARDAGKSTAAISWKVSGADGDEQFAVEHSTDGKKFLPFTKLNAEKGRDDYGVYHTMVKGYNFYRLRTTDVSNHITYSKIVRLWCSEPDRSIALLPNMVRDNATLNVTVDDNSKVQLIITDAGGKLVYKSANELQAGMNNIKLSLSELAAGSYTLHIQVENDTVLPLKFVKL